MWKMDQLSQEIIDWTKQGKRLFDDVKHENDSMHATEKHVYKRLMADSTPLVVNVAEVPTKIDGDIFQKSTGFLNLTALRSLVRQLNLKDTDTDPPE